MRFYSLAAGLIGALLLPVAASAADLEDRDGPYGRHAESPYDDPRYRDLYADPPPPPPPAPHYTHPRYAPPPPYPRSYGDAPYLAPMPPPRRFSEAPDDRRGECLARREVHERLLANGWSGFRDIEVRGQVAYVTAQRPSGRSFDLEVDRCTGTVLSARRVGDYGRPYAAGRPYDNRGY